MLASILNTMLQQFTEDNNLRADTQAGFCPGFSTVHQLFALFDQANAARKPLFCWFLDLKGAYDSVEKTKVLAFSQALPGPFQRLCNGQPLEWVEHFKDLGLHFNAQLGLHACYADLL
jgi:hypothetical protein